MDEEKQKQPLTNPANPANPTAPKRIAKIVIPGIGEFEAPEPTAGHPTLLGEGLLPKVLHVLANPETVAGAASLVPGVGTLGAAGIGAGTSAVRDIAEGERDPFTIGLHAAEHGAVNAIPGGAEAMMAKRGAGTLASVAGGAMTGGAKGGLLAAIKAALGLGGEGAAASGARFGARALEGQTVNGVPVLSSEGLKILTKKSVELANANAPGATIAALDKLIAQVQQHLANPDAASLLTKVGLPLRSAAAVQGAKMANRMRALLGLGGAGIDAYDAMNGQR